jgi:hypothetical protein
MERNTFTAAQEKWLQALESGAYRQCQQMLRMTDSAGCNRYCCLGVAVEVCGLQETSECDLGDSYEALMLRSKSGDVLLPHKAERSTLIGLNDGLEWSFAQIAAFIRANPWQVFTNFDAAQEDD